MIEFLKRIFASKSNTPEKYDLGEVSEEHAKVITKETGVNVTGFRRIIENFGLFHAIKKHGSKNEYKRGQIPITLKDFEKIPDITNHPDTIEAKGKR